MKNDSYTTFVARAAARRSLEAGPSFLRTETAALVIARNDFGHGAPPNRGGFNTELARRVIAEAFDAAGQAAA